MLEYVVIGIMCIMFGIMIIGSIAWTILIPVIIWRLIKKILGK